MVTIKFLYMMNEYTIKVNKEKFNYETFKGYAKLIGTDLNKLYFSIKGKLMIINEKSNIKIGSKIEKKEIKILVFNLRNVKGSIKPNQKAPNIICPYCKQLALIKINEDKITISNCINKNHISPDLTIEEFIGYQNYDESKVKCEFCQNLKYLYNIFFICSCGKNICPICLQNHKSEHSVIYYKNRFNECKKHSIPFCSYYKECNVNLCPTCER